MHLSTITQSRITIGYAICIWRPPLKNISQENHYSISHLCLETFNEQIWGKSLQDIQYVSGDLQWTDLRSLYKLETGTWKLLFDKQKFLWKIFNFYLFGLEAVTFSNKSSSYTCLKWQFTFLTQKTIKSSWYKNLKKLSSYLWMARNFENCCEQASLKLWLRPWLEEMESP